MMVHDHEHYYGAGISDERFRAAAELASVLERQAPWLKNLMLKSEDGSVWFVYDAELWRRRPHSCEGGKRFKYHTEANPFGEGIGKESGYLLLACESTDSVDYTDYIVDMVRTALYNHACFTFKKA